MFVFHFFFFSWLKFFAAAWSPLMDWRPSLGWSTPVLGPRMMQCFCSRRNKKQMERTLDCCPHPSTKCLALRMRRQREACYCPYSWDIHVQVFWGAYFFTSLEWITRSEIAGSCGNCKYTVVFNPILCIFLGIMHAFECTVSNFGGNAGVCFLTIFNFCTIFNFQVLFSILAIIVWDFVISDLHQLWIINLFKIF